MIEGKKDSISIIDDTFQSFAGTDRFASTRKESSTISCLSAVAIEASPWFDTKEIIDNGRKQFRVNATFTEFKPSMKQDGILNYAV